MVTHTIDINIGMNIIKQKITNYQDRKTYLSNTWQPTVPILLQTTTSYTINYLPPQ